MFSQRALVHARFRGSAQDYGVRPYPSGLDEREYDLRSSTPLVLSSRPVSCLSAKPLLLCNLHRLGSDQNCLHRQIEPTTQYSTI